MTIHLFLDIIISISIIFAFSNKYAKQGLLLVGLTFLAAAITTYTLDRDIILSLFEAVASFSTLYEYFRTRSSSYTSIKKTKLSAGIILVLLGACYAAIGVISPFLIAGVVSLFVILVEGTVSSKQPKQKL